MVKSGGVTPTPLGHADQMNPVFSDGFAKGGAGKTLEMKRHKHNCIKKALKRHKQKAQTKGTETTASKRHFHNCIKKMRHFRYWPNQMKTSIVYK